LQIYAGLFVDMQGSFADMQGLFADMQGSSADIQGSFADMSRNPTTRKLSGGDAALFRVRRAL